MERSVLEEKIVYLENEITILKNKLSSSNEVYKCHDCNSKNIGVDLEYFDDDASKVYSINRLF